MVPAGMRSADCWGTHGPLCWASWVLYLIPTSQSPAVILSILQMRKWIPRGQWPAQGCIAARDRAQVTSPGHLTKLCCSQQAICLVSDQLQGLLLWLTNPAALCVNSHRAGRAPARVMTSQPPGAPLGNAGEAPLALVPGKATILYRSHERARRKFKPLVVTTKNPGGFCTWENPFSFVTPKIIFHLLNNSPFLVFFFSLAITLTKVIMGNRMLVNFSKICPHTSTASNVTS